jgi:uncharacterized protein (TIGR01777 family)
LLGTVLRQALVDRDGEILQLVRRQPASAGELKWDPEASPLALAPERLEGFQAAIHLSGSNVAGRRWTPAYKREIQRSRVGSTGALATLLARLRKPPEAFLVASACGVYGDRKDEILDEQSSPGKGFLADVCQEWEAAARPAEEAGIRVVHLRFGVVLTPSGGALGKMLPLFRLGLGGRLGSGKQWMSWISMADAVAAILFAMDTPALAGPINLTAPEPVTNAQFTRALARAVHRPAILPAPAFALRIFLGQMANEALLASERVLPARLLSAGFQFAHPVVDEALAASLAQGA